MDEVCLQAIKAENQGKRKDKEAILSAYKRGQILLEKELAAVNSVLRYVPKDSLAEARKVANRIKSSLKSIFKISCEKAKLITGMDELPKRAEVSEKPTEFWDQVYSRLFRGPLDPDYLYTRIDEKRREHYRRREQDDPSFQVRLTEIMNFMDGKRTLDEIASLVSAEYPGLILDDLKNFVKDLKATGIISLVQEE
jgi:hypothetical protein